MISRTLSNSRHWKIASDFKYCHWPEFKVYKRKGINLNLELILC